MELRNFVSRILFLFAFALSVTATNGQATFCNDTAAISKQLDSIRKIDQGVRQVLIQQLAAGDTVKIHESFRKMNAADKGDQQVISKLLDNCGWPPGISAMGNNTIFLVIDHADTVFMNKYLPVLKKQADKGIVAKTDLATLQDRILMKQGKAQVYGTQTFKNKKTGITNLWPVENADHLDERRKSIGLTDITAYLEMVKTMYYTQVTWDRELTAEQAFKLMH